MKVPPPDPTPARPEAVPGVSPEELAAALRLEQRRCAGAYRQLPSLQPPWSAVTVVAALRGWPDFVRLPLHATWLTLLALADR